MDVPVDRSERELGRVGLKAWREKNGAVLARLFQRYVGLDNDVCGGLRVQFYPVRDQAPFWTEEVQKFDFSYIFFLMAC